MAAEAKYHLNCLTDLRNRYKRMASTKRQELFEKDEKTKESQAFIELLKYIKTSIENEMRMFLLSELHSLYVSRLKT